MGDKKLYKSTKNKILGGVCGGIAEYFSVDPLLVRAAFVVLPGSLLLYIILWFACPTNPGTGQMAQPAPAQ